MVWQFALQQNGDSNFYSNPLQLAAIKMSRIERVHPPYLPLLWPVQQSEAPVEHNEVLLTLGLNTANCVTHTSLSHVSLVGGAPT